MFRWPSEIVDFEFRFIRDGYTSSVWRNYTPADSRGNASFRDRLSTPILVQTSLDPHADRAFTPRLNSTVGGYYLARVRGYLIRK